MRTFVLILIATALAGTAAPARAQIDAPVSPEQAALREQARARSELGKRHYELGDYGAAIAAYREAYLLLPSPGVLFNLGQAYRMRGDCAAAAGAYRSFLRSDPSGPPATLARQQLPSVDACARSSETASARHDRRLREGGAITGVLGLATLGVATYFALDARRAETEVEAFSRRGGRWSDIAAADARGQRSSERAIGFAIGGGALVATGAVLYVLGRHRAPSEHANVWLAPTATSATVGASWGF